MSAALSKRVERVGKAMSLMRPDLEQLVTLVKAAPAEEREAAAQLWLEQHFMDAAEMPELVGGFAALIGRRVDHIDQQQWESPST